LADREIEKEKKKWYVMRAYKNEKIAEEKLSAPGGLEFYIPKHYSTRTYHGKVRKELVPVIPSIIFVHASRQEITKFKKCYEILQYVMWKTGEGVKFITVPDGQMDSFIRVSKHYEEDIIYYKPEDFKFSKGSRVRVHGGIFDGVVGIFVKVAGRLRKRVVIVIDNVTAVATAEITPDLLEILPN
jgi:hypothetical protein